MKTVYFVRHGESESNARTTRTYKGKESELTEKGTEQAQIIARRAERIPFDCIISSPWIRTRRTAEAIAARTGKQIEFSELFTEVRAPSSCIGMELSDPLFRARLDAWHASTLGRAARVEDGENFDDLIMRVRDALTFLENRKEENILVATHGLFLRTLLAHILVGDDVTPEQVTHFLASSKSDNTGVTVLTFGEMPQHEIDGSKRWRLRVFNDHSHLG
jgi:probable phosphoglycerate mutase